MTSGSVIGNQAQRLHLATPVLSGELEQGSAGRFSGCCVDLATTNEVQSVFHAKSDNLLRESAWNDERKCSVLGKQHGHFLDKLRKRQTLVVARQSTASIVWQSVLCEERRIAENRIERCLGFERQYILQDAFNSPAERTFSNILACLSDGRFVNVNTQHIGFRIPLRSH